MPGSSESVLAKYFESTTSSEVTALDAPALAAAMDAELKSVSDEDTAVFLIGAVQSYIDFLSETGRWSSSQDHRAELEDIFLDTDDPDSNGLTIRVPVLAKDEELAAFAGLPLIQKATAFLQWLGDGRSVTATGVPEPAGLEEAARVGMAVPGALTLWTALEMAELIHVSSAHATPTADVQDFLAGSAPERLEEYRFFTGEFLRRAAIGGLQGRPERAESAALKISILVSATTEEPPSVKGVLAAEDYALEVEKALVGALTRSVVEHLEQLAALGLIETGTHSRVPPAVIGCVAAVFADDVVYDT